MTTPESPVGLMRRAARLVRDSARAMKPGVGLALADLLDARACQYDSFCHGTLQVLTGATGAPQDPPLRLARALLGQFDVPPRAIIGWDEKGFPCLAGDCPQCGAAALILNEWDAIECLTCSWQEIEPDDPRADYSKWPDRSRAAPGAS
jgi:hypothetical protein